MIELLIAFGAGLISFLSPCVLPLIPGYISFISGASLKELLEKKKINFACWSSDKTIFSNLAKGLSNSQGFDSDIDSTLFQDQ